MRVLKNVTQVILGTLLLTAGLVVVGGVISILLIIPQILFGMSAVDSLGISLLILIFIVGGWMVGEVALDRLRWF